jgi:hypothetical protein
MRRGKRDCALGFLGYTTLEFLLARFPDLYKRVPLGKMDA